MQDFTGVPAVVDLAAMRDAMIKLGGDPEKINPLSPVDLVIDHSVMVDYFAGPGAFKKNVELEYQRNGERYAFLRWGQRAFENFRVVPPGTGICHQVNLENLAQVVWTAKEPTQIVKGKKKIGKTIAYPDTLVGTDSHTTMVNGLAVLGWGVGGIEAEAAMLGQPISMLIPEVIGFKLSGKLKEGTTATDLVLTVTQMLRKKGVVGKFVEFYGPGLEDLALADRATIANMAPEYGATCGFFPVDAETLRYMKATGRAPARIALAEKYAKAQGMWRDAKTPDPVFTDTLELDISTVESSLAGPKRPQDRVPLTEAAVSFKKALTETFSRHSDHESRISVKGTNYDLGDGDVVIAAITSCTNTSNPSVMLGAGLIARNAVKLGLKSKPWVKTSLAPGSQVVTDYLKKSGLQTYLDKIGFNLVGYGCTTCIGNSGPLPDPIADAITLGDLVAAAVLSGNRNFEGRVNPHVKANYLASPMLVVVYALAGSMKIDIAKDPIGYGKNDKPVYLKDLWPTNKEIADAVRKSVTPAAFKKRYKDVFTGDQLWRKVKIAKGQTYMWDKASTYVQNPPYFVGMSKEAGNTISRHREGAAAGDPRRFHHHRPHLARRLDQEGRPGRPVPDRQGRRSGRLQLLRRAARQSRGDDARHLRQHPPQERDGARHRGRRHAAHAGRHADADLRCLDEIPEAGRAAGRVRRQGIRHRLLARLGGQGHRAARHQGGDRRELRAHPPLQPGRHGRAAAAVQGRHDAQDARISTAARCSTSPAWPPASSRAWT